MFRITISNRKIIIPGEVVDAIGPPDEIVLMVSKVQPIIMLSRGRIPLIWHDCQKPGRKTKLRPTIKRDGADYTAAFPSYLQDGIPGFNPKDSYVIEGTMHGESICFDLGEAIPLADPSGYEIVPQNAFRRDQSVQESAYPSDS